MTARYTLGDAFGPRSIPFGDRAAARLVGFAVTIAIASGGSR